MTDKVVGRLVPVQGTQGMEVWPAQTDSNRESEIEEKRRKLILRITNHLAKEYAPLDALLVTLEVLAGDGQSKYPARGYIERCAAPGGRVAFFEAAERHTMASFAGEVADRDSGKPPGAHVAGRHLMILQSDIERSECT